jgi:PAS domain S-box-containing protein
MKLSTSAALAMSAVALISTAIVGTATYKTVEGATVRQAQELIESHLDMVAELLETARGAPDVLVEPRRFDRLRTSALPGGRIYLLDERGDDIAHPDRDRGLASAVGRWTRLGDDFPALAATMGAGQAGFRSADLRQGGIQSVADWTGEPFGLGAKSVHLTDGRTVTLIEALPESVIKAPMIATRGSIVDAALVASLAAVALAIAFARALASPLREMTTAVQSFARNETFSLPTSAPGEIGILAGAFEQVTADITASAAEMARYDQMERQYIAAVESSALAFITTQLDGTITAWSRGAVKLFGYTADETVGRNVLMVVPDDRHREVVDILEKIRSGETVENRRTVRVDKSGRQIHVAISVAPILDASGRPGGASAILQDITRQTLAEEKFRLAVESCPNGMVMVDSAGTIVLVNGEIERLFEYDREELIGQPIEILVPARLREQHAAERGEFIGRPETRPMGSGRDLLGRRKSGSEFSVEVGLNPIETDEGPLVLGVIVDITERKQAQEMFQLAVEACPSGMMMIDGHGSIVMANREVERLFGYGRGELVARPVDILVPERLRERHRRQREDFNAWPEARSIGAGRDLLGLHKNGSELPVEIGLNPIHLGDDELMVLCVVQDISERKRAEHLKDEFVATVSHELRTPLTSIAASLGLLAGNQAIALPETAKRLITIAHTNSQRLVRLINDILDVEKMESGQVMFDLKRIEVRSLVEQAIEASRGLADSRDVALRLDEASVAADVNADPDRLTQVVVNLLSNAVKFSPGGAEVVVSVAHRDGIVRVGVRDLGTGIPEEFKARIFDKFAQADSSDARQKGGTGLGLSIVRQIVTRLEGEVGFSDAPGGGTVFHVDLPDWDSLKGTAGPAHAEPAGTRVLICEDYPPLAKVLAAQLGREGFATDIALSGADVIDKATSKRYAAILVDLQLSDCDGISLISELRAQPQNRDTPIVVVASDVNRGRDDPRSSGLRVLDWVRKPVDVRHLAGVLQRATAPAVSRRPRILHLDNDPEMLRAVAREIESIADVTSVATLAAARAALATGQFDVVVTDSELSTGSGAELFADLRDSAGYAVPVIAVSRHRADAPWAALIREALDRNAGSIRRLSSRERIGRAGRHAKGEASA